MGLALQLLYIIISLPLEYFLGVLILGKLLPWIEAHCENNEEAVSAKIESWPRSFRIALAFSLGLVVHLAASFVLSCLRLPWLLACLLPLLPALFLLRDKWAFKIKLDDFALSTNFGLWLVAHVILATSLFSVGREVTTPWANNYGDLTFHIGIIRSFIWGDNFPPEMPLYPGVELGYPVLVNYWTATWTWLAPALRCIKFAFAMQWIIIWSLIYFLLNGSCNRLLPWAILLAGGSYFTWSVLDLGQKAEYSWQLLGKGYPWTVFLSTIWVTQRSALLGTVLLLAVVRMYLSLREQHPVVSLVSAFFILSMGVLCHVHFALVGFAFIGLMEMPRWRAYCSLKKALFVIGCLLPLLIFVPFFNDKGGIAKPIWGWSVGKQNAYQNFQTALKVETNKTSDGARPSISSASRYFSLSVPYFAGGMWSATKMWFVNAWQVFLLFGLLLIVHKKRQPLLIISGLFVVGNFLGLNYWDWDQIKYFAALYLLLVVLSCDLIISTQWQKCLLSLALILLLLPAAWEVIQISLKEKSAAPYDQNTISTAVELNKVTPKNAIIAGAPRHNTPITLAGRKIFLGYDGTIWSHGLRDQAEYRFKMMRDLPSLIRCRSEKRELVCPEFLLWTDSERRHWKVAKPPRMDLMESTSMPSLYRIRE